MIDLSQRVVSSKPVFNVWYNGGEGKGITYRSCGSSLHLLQCPRGTLGIVSCAGLSTPSSGWSLDLHVLFGCRIPHKLTLRAKASGDWSTFRMHIPRMLCVDQILLHYRKAGRCNSWPSDTIGSLDLTRAFCEEGDSRIFFEVSIIHTRGWNSIFFHDWTYFWKTSAVANCLISLNSNDRLQCGHGILSQPLLSSWVVICCAMQVLHVSNSWSQSIVIFVG